MRQLIPTLAAVIALLLPFEPARAQLATNGLVCEYRFDEGNTAWAPSRTYATGALVRNGTRVYSCTQAGTSASSGGPTGTGTSISDGTAKWNYSTIVNGYDSSGIAQAGLSAAPGSSYNQAWDGKGVQATNSMLIFKTGGTPVMSVAQTVIVAADIAPGNVFMGAPSILGGHTIGGTATVELNMTNQGGFAVNGSADSGWYAGSQLGAVPILRKQGALVQTWVNGTANGNNAAIFTGTTKESYYLSRGSGRLTNVTWEVSLGADAAFGFSGGIYYAVIYNRVLSDAEVAQCVNYIQGVLVARGVSLGDTIPVNRPVMIFQGDSITYGVGAAYGQGWANLVGRSLYGAYRDVNAALPAIQTTGTTGSGYINFGPANADPVLATHGSSGSNVAFIYLGANDLITNVSSANLTAGLQDRVNKVRAAGAAKVVMATLTPRSGGNETTRAAVNLNILGTGATPITGIDAIADFGNDPMMGLYANTTESTKTYYGDGVHPTQLGHKILAGIANAALVSLGIDTEKLVFGNLGASAANGASSGGYNTYRGTVANYETTGCYTPSKKLQNSPPFEIYYSAVVPHLGQVALGLHTDATTDTGISGAGKTRVAYSLVNSGSGTYAAGGSAGGWLADTNSLVPAAGDRLRYFITAPSGRPVVYTLYAQVSQDGGHIWTNIAHQAAPAGDLYPRLMSNDAAMSDVPVKCNGAVSNVAPLWTVSPVISSPIVGTPTTITGSAVGYPIPSYTYQWKLDGTAIVGATFPTYTPASGDATHSLTCAVTATNSMGSAVIASNTQTVPLTPMQTWFSANGLPVDGSGDGALTASPARDGIANLTKYALGINAKTPGFQGRFTTGTVTDSGSNYLSFTYTRAEPAPADVTFIPESTPDISTVSWSASNPPLISSTASISGSMSAITVRDTIPIGATSRRFLHLRITSP